MNAHPLADIFPLVEGPDFDELVADIRAHGQREPVVLYEGLILDGRNRYRACLAAGVACWTEPYDGDDPLAYVISLNLRRRHLTESQRAMVAARLATLRDGQRADLVEGLPIGRASTLLNVGERTVARAREVQEHGAPELQHAVDRGDVSVSAAADVATLPASEQVEIVARGEREILRAAVEIRARKANERRGVRLQKLTEISKGNADLPSDRQWPLLYADPPYRYERPSFGPTREIEEHYPTLPLEDICALPVAQIATPDAILFLWVPPALLEQAFAIFRAWDFDYRTGMVWDKESIGLGLWVRQQHEHLLIAVRRDFPLPDPAVRPPSVFKERRREHSQKPDIAYEIIERMYPGLPRIELFARRERPDWDRWGNEAPPDDPDIPAFLRRTAP